MLVLTRQRDEEIVIGDDPNLIIIQVIEIRGDKVRLGVTAPSTVPVHRKEVYLRILEENANKNKSLARLPPPVPPYHSPS